jgi:hypothetical protein
VGLDNAVLERAHRLLEEALGERIDGTTRPMWIEVSSSSRNRLELGVVEDDPTILGERLLPVEDDALVPLELVGQGTPARTRAP